MNNNELNIFEIMGAEDPKAEKSSYQKKQTPSGAGREGHTLDKNGQEQNVPGSFFQDAIEQAFSQNRTGARTYSDGESIPTYAGRPPAYQNERDSRGGTLRGIGSKVESLGKRIKGRGAAFGGMSDALRGGWKEIAAETMIVVLAVVFVYHFILSISHVSGDSMSPAFCDGDRVLILRVAKGTIEKGDVIVFETAQGEKLIKRVVAAGGDTVDISKSKGGLYVNGEALEEDYIYTVTSITDEKVTYPITVNADCYFVLGDNRTNSKDSRNSEIGLVKKEDVMGKVILNIRGT